MYEPCIVLIFSIQYFKRQIRKQNQKVESFMKLVAKERLMLAHTTIFAVFLILFTIREVLAYIGYFDESLQKSAE